MFSLNLNRNKNVVLTAAIGLSLVSLNLIAQVFDIDIISHPFGLPASMTVYTSLSLAFIFSAFMAKTRLSQKHFAISAILIQLISILTIKFEVSIPWEFLVSSSIPTSLVIVGISMLIFFSRNVQKHFDLIAASIFMLCIVFLFGFIFDDQTVLGINTKVPGVGLNFITFLCFLSIGALFHFYKIPMITFCSWTGKVKANNLQWVKPDVFLSQMGIDITHGISPEMRSQFKSRRKK